MAHAVSRTKSDLVLVAADLHPQTWAVLATRAAPLGLRLLDFAPGDTATVAAANACAVILQYPGTTGAVRNLAPRDRCGARGRQPGRSCARTPLSLISLTSDLAG